MQRVLRHRSSSERRGAQKGTCFRKFTEEMFCVFMLGLSEFWCAVEIAERRIVALLRMLL